jgi:ABC-2 type transport system ATP-binding protein
MKKQTRAHDALVLEDISVQRGSFGLKVAELRIRPGTINCVVGLNGSGKTSLLLTALGLLPHEGTCFVDGIPYDGADPKVKCRVGFIPDDPDLLFEELTAKEQWTVVASVLHKLGPQYDYETMLAYAEKVAHRLSFLPPACPSRDYSHGMRKKTQIISAVMGSPSLLIIDELRNGLDPLAITQAESLVQDLCADGAAALIATHDLWWAERFADNIFVLHDGRIAASGPLASLTKGAEKHLEQAFIRLVGAQYDTP